MTIYQSNRAVVFREAAENGSTPPYQIQYKGALALESNDSSAPLSYLPLRPMITYFKARVVFAAAFWCSVVGSLSAQRLSDVRDFLGPGFGPSRTQTKSPLQLPHGTSASEFLRHWNAMAVDASGLDHTPLASGDTSRVFGEQLGPARASRAMAIMHIAMFDAVNAIDHKYQGFTNIPPVRSDASMTAAIAQAACDTLDALFPSQRSTFDQTLTAELAQMHDNRPKLAGIEVGHRAAAAILALRAGDGSLQAEPRLGIQFFTSNDPGKWRQDPISQSPVALGAYWGQVQPFVLQSSTQFRAPTPPAINSPDTLLLTMRQSASAATEFTQRPSARQIKPRPESFGLMTGRRVFARRRGYTTRSSCTLPISSIPAKIRSNWRDCLPWSTSPWRMLPLRSGNRNSTTNIGGRSPRSANRTSGQGRQD